MSEEFKVIETQEQLDAIIKSRLEREHAKAVKETEEKYADYEALKGNNSSLQQQLEDLNKELTGSKEKLANHDKEVADLNSKIAQYEKDSVKTKVAIEMGIPFELKDKLSGDDEEAIRNDAKTLAAFVNKQASAPGYKSEPPEGDSTDSAYKSMLGKLFND